jgi:hypothetical protein
LLRSPAKRAAPPKKYIDADIPHSATRLSAEQTDERVTVSTRLYCGKHKETGRWKKNAPQNGLSEER